MTDNYLEILQQLAVPEYAPRPKPTPIPEAAWNDAPLFCLRLNDEWVSHVLGVMTALDQPDTWEGTEEEIDAARQQVNEIMLAFMAVCEEEPMTVYPESATFWHDQAQVVTGGAFVTLSPAIAPYNLPNHFYNTFSYQSSLTNGDSFAHTCLLAAGDYNFMVLGLNSPANGIIEWYVDGDLFSAGHDWYNAAVQPNITHSGSVTIAEPGLHVLTGVLNGKHSSSSAYGQALTKYWLERVP